MVPDYTSVEIILEMQATIKQEKLKDDVIKIFNKIEVNAREVSQSRNKRSSFDAANRNFSREWLYKSSRLKDTSL